MTDLIADIAEAADDLTEPRMHREPLYEWTAQRNRRMVGEHRVRLPSLLDQLADMFAPGSRGEGGARSVPGSRPPVNLEAVSAHAYIGAGAARWAWTLQVDIRDTTASTIRGLVGAASLQDSDTQSALLVDLRHWRHQAQVLTGWSTPLFRPRVACPACDRVGTIRINLTRQVADCSAVTCVATWGPDSLGILAEYIRTVTEGVAA